MNIIGQMGKRSKKPIKCSAPKYIDYLMTWVQDQLDDETLFPSKIGVKFLPHFQEVVSLGEEAHLNTSFKHFIYFVQEFQLIEKKELAPLQELIDRLTANSEPTSKMLQTTEH